MIERNQILQCVGGDLFGLTLDTPQVLAQQVVLGRRLDELIFTDSQGSQIPGYFLHPPVPNAPAILYCHAHGARYDIGIRELTDGRLALIRPYLQDLADAGFAVLCLEMPTFGRRAEPKEGPLSKALHWHGRTLFGQMLAELIAGISYLAEHPLIDPERIGTMGISMGGTHAWWLAALDPRVSAAVSMCSFADLGLLVETGAHDSHGPYMTVPGLLAHCTTGALAGLAAPRPQLHCIGLADPLTPEPAVTKAHEDLQNSYKTSPENLQFHMEKDIGHQETEAMRNATLAFLKKHLL